METDISLPSDGSLPKWPQWQELGRWKSGFPSASPTLPPQHTQREAGSEAEGNSIPGAQVQEVGILNPQLLP